MNYRKRVLRDRTRRAKGIPANRQIENRLVKIFVGHGKSVQKELWDDIGPYLAAVLPIGATVDLSVLDAYKKAFDRFTNLDEIKARADRLFEKNSQTARTKFREMLNRTLGVKFDSLASEKGDREDITRAIGATVDRIVTINAEHFDKLKRAIESAVLDGRPLASIRDAVLSVTGEVSYPDWMVERVVVDQYLTAHASIQQRRQQASGITHYFWRTASDARVRSTHADKEGKRFSWSDPPLDTGHPGNDIRCRCIADPDLSTVGVTFKSAF
jgi:SPP1 gp7 family putative phage head morphogenesis protein